MSPEQSGSSGVETDFHRVPPGDRHATLVSVRSAPVGDRIRLDPEPRSVGQARRYCTSVLRGWGADADLVDTCELLVGELATNAVLHARTPFTVGVSRLRGIRVEVRDGDPSLPLARDNPIDAISGRGLQLVEALTRASGAEPSGGGKAVWFELDWAPALAR